MIRLKPRHWSDKAVKQDLFPPQDKYFTEIFAKDYRTFLETNATTDGGMEYVAKHYGIKAQWKSYLDVSRQNNCAKDYYRLLQIVKTLSNKDYVWISLIEGLHWHAAIVMCLTCLLFDLEDNNIENSLLIRKDFKLAGVPQYKKPEMSPMDVLNAILNNQFDAPMLMTAFLVWLFVPKYKNFQIDTLMTMLKQSSMWISTNKNLLLRNLYQNGLQMNLQPLWNSPHLIKKTSISQYLRNNLSIRLTLIKISLITSAKRRGNMGCGTHKYYQVTSTPTISRIH
jgi:hypothetical protein